MRNMKLAAVATLLTGEQRQVAFTSSACDEGYPVLGPQNLFPIPQHKIDAAVGRGCWDRHEHHDSALITPYGKHSLCHGKFKL
jgi:hypothetical protein